VIHVYQRLDFRLLRLRAITAILRLPLRWRLVKQILRLSLSKASASLRISRADSRLKPDPSLRSGFRLKAPARHSARLTPSKRLGKRSFAQRTRSGFRVRTPARLAPRSRPQCRSKCNEALSRDLWPLDPFESAPMRATSSVLCNSIPDANRELVEIKELTELPGRKAGRNSLILKIFPCEFFPYAVFAVNIT